MTAEQFAYWLQGFAELNPEPPTAAQWQSIREHVGSVFGKVTPPLRLDLLADESAAPSIPVETVRRILQPRRAFSRDRLIC